MDSVFFSSPKYLYGETKTHSELEWTPECRPAILLPRQSERSRSSALTLLSCSQPLPEAANGFAYRRRWAVGVVGWGGGGGDGGRRPRRQVRLGTTR